MNSESPQTVPHESQAAFRKLLRGGSWAFLGKFLTYPFGLFVTLILAKILSTQEMGGYFLVMSTVMISSMLVRGGLDSTMCKIVARSLANESPRAAKQTLRIGAIAFLIAATIALSIFGSDAGTLLFGVIEGGPQLYNLLGIVGAMVVLFACIGYSCEILRGFNDLRSAALLDQQALQRFLQVLGLLIIISAGISFQLRDALFLTMGAMAISAALGVIMVVRKYRNLGVEGEPVRKRDILSNAPPFLLIRISAWVFDGAAIWVLSTSRALDEAALYGAANALSLLMLAPAQVVNSAIGPTLVTLHARGKMNDLRTAARAASAFIAIPAVVGAVILMVLGELALEVLFTSEYRDAYLLLVVLAAGRALSTVFGIPLSLLSMTHHQDIVFRTLLLTSGLTLAAFVFAAHRYGAVGVAWVSAGSIILQGMLLAILSWRVLRINTLPRLSTSTWRNLIAMLRRKD